MLNSLEECLKDPKKDISLSKDTQGIFEHIQTDLAEVTMLAHPDSDTDLGLMMYASDEALSGALYHVVDETHQPLAFYPQRLTQTEQRYHNINREFLVVYSSMKYFIHMLIVSQFHVLPDHKPLCRAYKSASHKYSPHDSSTEQGTLLNHRSPMAQTDDDAGRDAPRCQALL
ncbi:unnamed protein product [Protopolystoma xenopodis]|uniref:Reverse transcriptase/retrotransposon-derived protein RNase H-like domain-containing protein n=1 Tax=Protopolystoma xenopodis TaxID=117903 RepID=A0A448WSZ3_9PLAT|nr:unnamed protein product [Protopolystoma xenopodis]